MPGRKKRRDILQTPPCSRQKLGRASARRNQLSPVSVAHRDHKNSHRGDHGHGRVTDCRCDDMDDKDQSLIRSMCGGGNGTNRRWWKYSGEPPGRDAGITSACARRLRGHEPVERRTGRLSVPPPGGNPRGGSPESQQVRPIGLRV